MMRRAPLWFTRGKTISRLKDYWPWALGLGLAGMYYLQPEPFEEVGQSALAVMRRPLLRGTEWLEVRDVDPETMALELPPDQVFGPLPLKQQMDFLLQALNADNELADMYLTRLIIDHMDISLDPPPLGNLLVECRGRELLDFAVSDFTEQRQPRKHAFFNADQFIRLLNICAAHNELADHFVQNRDGIKVLFQALKASTESYTRVLAMRCLTLFAFMQPEDGEVEKQLLIHNCVPGLVDAYRNCTGDATDSRFTTCLLSSMLRHYPEAAATELARENIVQVIVDQINVARYKALPQHYRVLEDLRKLPQAVKDKVGLNVEHALFTADFLPVALGVMDAFPEYLESVDELLKLVALMKEFVAPMSFVEYRLLSVANKLFHRYETDNRFAQLGAKQRLLDLVTWACNDSEVNPHLTGGTREVKGQFATMKRFLPDVRVATA